MVTHGDCVGAALSLMQTGNSIQSVGFGSMFVAQRKVPSVHAANGSPCSNEQLEDGLDEKTSAMPELPEAAAWQVQVHGITLKAKHASSRVCKSVEESLQGLQALPYSTRKAGIEDSDSIARFEKSNSYSDDSHTPTSGRAAKGAGQSSTRKTLELVKLFEQEFENLAPTAEPLKSRRKAANAKSVDALNRFLEKSVHGPKLTLGNSSLMARRSGQHKISL
eukprot:TRINITY_DN8893_c0_g1_i1.p1 TRINITY_DN8893_c0_g1~~TRINITY_DN8893_c0_g1_i1.p1  ORF type:complete len:221 (-),score=31.64 TRINITY_DN8893_c0_g1_i1:39-701(-)